MIYGKLPAESHRSSNKSVEEVDRLREIMVDKPKDDMSRDYLFDKVVEAHKMRQAVQVALFIAYVTVLQVNVDKKSAVLVFFSVLIPPLAFVIDVITKYAYISPFLYKGLMQCRNCKDEEPIELLFLSYGRPHLKYTSLLNDPTVSSERRQKAFRKAYTFRNIRFKVIFYILFTVISVSIWAYYNVDLSSSIKSTYSVTVV